MSSFNSFFSYIKPDMYHQVINTASVSTSFSWSDTLVWTAYLAPNFMAAWGMAPMIGEMKSAENLKTVTLAMLLPGFVSLTTYSLLAWFMFSTFGQTFLVSLGSLMGSGNPLLASTPFPLYFIYLPLIVVPNVALVLLFGIMVCAVALWCNASNMLPPSRYIFAQSFDRVLPKAFGYVHPRYHTPFVALSLSVIGGIIWIIWSTFSPSMWMFAAAAGVANLAADESIVCIAGIILSLSEPQRCIEASPCGKYRVAGVPLISIVGLLGLYMGYHQSTTSTCRLQHWERRSRYPTMPLSAFS